MIRPFPVREEAAAEEAAEEGEAAASPEAEEATPSDFRAADFKALPQQNTGALREIPGALFRFLNSRRMNLCCVSAL